MVKTIFIALAVFLFFSCNEHAADTLYTWTSKDGTQSIEGSFLSLEEGVVLIALANGKRLAFLQSDLNEESIRHSETAAKEKTEILKSFGTLGIKLSGHLVTKDHTLFDWNQQRKTPPSYYLFYYSASWCPPCRQFTPKLVEWHQKMKERVEIILVPYDETEEKMFEYMAQYHIDFPALYFDSKALSWIPQGEGQGIPALLLVDKNGKRIMSNTDVPHDQFLDAAEKRLAP